MNENNFIEEIKNKNQRAMEYIIEKYNPIVNGVIRKILNPLRNEMLIEECISDVFVSVWNNIDKFKGDYNNFKNWIAGISKYKAVDYYRKERRAWNSSEYIKETLISNTNIEEEIIKGIETNEVIKLINKFEEIRSYA